MKSSLLLVLSLFALSELPQSPAPGAPAVSLVGAAYDEARARLVIAGSAQGTGAETWVWRAPSWTKVDSGPLTGRQEPMMVYDRARKRIVLHGGTRGRENLADTWEWDGETWRLAASEGPPLRGGAAMTYDTRRQRTVLVGGSAMGDGQHFNDIWEWDGTRWQELKLPAGAAVPPARALHAVAYDEKRGRLVLTGGFAMVDRKPVPFEDTWEFDGTRWHQIDTPGHGGRDHISMAMVYAPHLGGVVVHSGGHPQSGLKGDTWLFDGKSWTKLADDGPRRGRHRLVYDTTERALLMYGGWAPERQQSTELWKFIKDRWVRLSPAP